MKANLKRLGTALVAVALIMSVVGPAMAFPGTIETAPPADSTTTVYMQDGKTIQTNYTANGSIDYALPLLNVTGASATDLAMNVTHGGVTYYKFGGTWDTYNSGEADTSTDFIHNVSGDELDDVPMNINENVTLTVTYWNASASNPTPANITVYVENGDVRSVQRVTEKGAPTDVDTASPPLYRPFSDDYQTVEVDDTVKVNGSSTDVIYTLSESNVSEPFANTTEELSSQGAFTFMIASVDADEDAKVPVFYKSAPDWYDTSEHGTYMTYAPDTDRITVHTEDSEFKGATTSDITFTNDVYRVTNLGTVIELNGGYTSRSGIGAAVDMAM